MWNSGVKTLIVFIHIFGIFAQNVTKFEEETTAVYHLETTSQPTYNANHSPYVFRNITHGLLSDPIFTFNNYTIIIPKFYYDGLKPDAFFWIGNGTIPNWAGILAHNVSLNASNGTNVTIILPNNLTVYSIDYLSIWCPSRNESFGAVAIPRNQIQVPENNEVNESITVIPKHHSQIPENIEVNDTRTVIPLRKCCGINEVLISSGCVPGNVQFNPEVSVHVHNETHIEDEPMSAQSIKFQPVVQHIICSGEKYPLIQDLDQYALLQNGTLVVRSMKKFFAPANYCFESINFGDETESIWLTNPLICFTGEVSKSNALFYIYATGILVSAVLLIITALFFLMIKEIRDTRGKCVICYSIAMAAAFILLAFAQFSGIENTSCEIFGFIIQFFLVQSFVWLTILSWETFYKIKHYDNYRYKKDKKRFKIFVIIGILVPVVVSLISFIIDRVPGIPNTFLKPKFGRNECWFDQSTKTMIYFYFPIIISIVINIILNILMKCYLVRFERNGANDISWKTTKIDVKPMFRSCVFVLIVMTLCWIMEVITFSVKDLGSFGIAMDIIDSLQGVFIFTIFILHRPVKDKLKKLKDKKYFRKLKQKEEPKPTEVLFKNGDCADHKLFLTDMRHIDSIEDFS